MYSRPLLAKSLDNGKGRGAERGCRTLKQYFFLAENLGRDGLVARKQKSASNRNVHKVKIETSTHLCCFIHCPDPCLILSNVIIRRDFFAPCQFESRGNAHRINFKKLPIVTNAPVAECVMQQFLNLVHVIHLGRIFASERHRHRGVVKGADPLTQVARLADFHIPLHGWIGQDVDD